MDQNTVLWLPMWRGRLIEEVRAGEVTNLHTAVFLLIKIGVHKKGQDHWLDVMHKSVN